ncbi:MAG TPA: histidine kinase [Pyrinomonadaceae bacterium]|nr:histidine kinase [Pyrinomonadaceae bacterium]
MNDQLPNNLNDTPARKRWWRFGLGFCVWTLLGLSFALSTYLGSRQDNVHISWSRIVSGYLADFYLWGMLSPLIFMMARRFELRARFPRNLLIHICLSIALSFVVLSAASPLVWYFGYVNLARNPTLAILWRNNAFSIYYFHQGLTIYWTTLVVAHALQYYRGQRESEKRTAQLAAQLAQAQLQALKMQIHPHFLFNTLNSIAALLHQDVEVADRMIARLGDFLRLTLQRSDAQTTDFAQELEFLRCYLDIERTRFADRLVVATEVEPQTLNLAVPNLILQPIVENAIRHGVARQTTAGNITIRAFQKSDRLIVQVEDNGPGLGTNPNGTNSGIGLSNTRARLAQHYGEDYRLEIVNAENRGVIVTLDIPASEAAKSET